MSGPPRQISRRSRESGDYWAGDLFHALAISVVQAQE